MNTKRIIKTAVIAAVYSALTLSLAPISYGILQMRISEVMTILPRYSKSSVWGVSLGCLISNYIGMAYTGSAGIVDVIFGTLATFLAAACTNMLNKNKWLAPLFPTVFNGIIVGGYLHILVFNTVNIFLCMLSVAVGEAIVCFLLGIPLINFLDKHKRIGEIIND